MYNLKTYGKVHHTADLHFDHEGVMKAANRPFSSIEEMNQTIVDNINSKCSSGDTLIINGDVGVYGKDPIPWLRKIKCHKVLVLGNHDKSVISWMKGNKRYVEFEECFDCICNELYLTDSGYDLYIAHYPIVEWDGYYKGRWMFYGHIHDEKQGPALLMRFVPTAINVGVDLNDFMPMTTAELIEKRREEYKVPMITDELLQSIIHPAIDDRAVKKLDLSGFANL